MQMGFTLCSPEEEDGKVQPPASWKLTDIIIRDQQKCLI